jgi:uncharacterized protein
LIYIDTSAFMKLIWREGETAALERFMGDRPGQQWVSSTLLVIEVRRAAVRINLAHLPRVDVALDKVARVGIGDAVVESAGRLRDPALRSLDAIHLATAILLGDAVDVMVTYDKRLATAAEAYKIPTVAPC